MHDEKDIVKQVPMPIGAIVIYPITKQELEQIEAGGPSSTLFAVMLALVGIGIGGLISILLTGPAPTDPPLRYLIAIILVTVTLLVGIVLGIVWWRLPNPVKGVLADVRSREMPPPASPTNAPALSPAPPIIAPAVQVNIETGEAMNLLHTVVAAGPQNMIEVHLSRPNANVVLLDEVNWWRYQTGQAYQYPAGGFFEVNVVRVRPPFRANWHLVIDLGGQPGDIAATYRVL